MWNPGPDVARASWQTMPALRTEEFFEVTWGLAAAGKTNDKGVPGILQSAVLLNEFRDEFRVVKPPAGVQRVVFGLLAPIGRALGRKARPAR